MEILKYILIVIEVLCSLLLIGLVLIQKSKGGGLGTAMGGGMGENVLGARAGTVLTKMTIILGSVFMANTLVLALMHSNASESSLMSQEVGTVGQPVPQPSPAVAQQQPVTPVTAGSIPELPSVPATDAAPAPVVATPDAEVEAPAPLDVEPIQVDVESP